MDDFGIDTDPRAKSNTERYMRKTSRSFKAIKSEDNDSDRMPAAKSVRQKTLRSIHPRPVEVVVPDGDHAPVPAVAGSQVGIMEEPLPSVEAEDATTTQREEPDVGDETPKGLDLDSDVDSQGDSRGDQIDEEADDRGDQQDNKEPSVITPDNPVPTAEAGVEAGVKADVKAGAKAKTIVQPRFTRSELIALGVAYATVATWPQIASYVSSFSIAQQYLSSINSFPHSFLHQISSTNQCI